MTDPIVNSEQMAQVQQAQAAAPTDVKAQAHAAIQEAYDGNSKVGSMGELREKAPEMYHATLKALAGRIVEGMRKHGERLKKAMRQG